MNKAVKTLLIPALLGSVILVFAALLSKLRTQRETLARREQEIESLRSERTEEQARSSKAEADGVAGRQDVMELRRQLQQLESQKAQLNQATLASQQLREQLASLQKPIAAEAQPVQDAVANKLGTRSQSGPGENSSPSEKDKLEAYICAGHLYQIALAAGWWAESHDDHAPADFVSLKDYLAPMTLVCPSATPKSRALTWESLDPSAITYQIRNPGMVWAHGASRVFADCPIHEIVAINLPGRFGIPSKYTR